MIQEGVAGLVEGEQVFDTIADNAVFEFLYKEDGRSALEVEPISWPSSLRVVILEYAVHGTVLRTGIDYDNHFISVITIEDRKIVHWRDYMDSYSAMAALAGS
ncbi:hypothetical protein AWV79_30515 [Cupriavidus sp. UYMMa02A]|nr:hypothetical protein AWV79_30515 [Cupriavidus sp. UYMMa02A]